MLCQKNLHKSCRMGRRIVVMKLICSLGHCECDDHTAHKLNQQHLTANWRAPWERDCSRMLTKVSSDWLPSYIKAMQLVLKIFKLDRYFLDRPCIRCTEGHGDICHTVSLLSIPVTYYVQNPPCAAFFELSVLQHGWWPARCSSQELHGMGKWS
jgi:hypothetical protein